MRERDRVQERALSEHVTHSVSSWSTHHSANLLYHVVNFYVEFLLLFIIRVKRELKRVYRNGCRYNERLNIETGGSKTPHIHWVVWVNIQ